MLQLVAPVVRREALAAGHERVWLLVPAIAARVQPGQLLAIKSSSSPLEPLLRDPLPVAAADPAVGTVVLLRRGDGSPEGASHAGESLDVLGPVGRGWRVAEGTRNILLLGTEAGVGALLFLASVASSRALNVTLLLGAAEDRPALPPALVPEAVEYQFARSAEPAGAVLDLLDTSLLRWADALYTTLPLDSYGALAERIRAARMRWEPGFAQGLAVPPMACFTGICDTCLVAEARRPWRACVNGPQCDVRDFAR